MNEKMSKKSPFIAAIMFCCLVISMPVFAQDSLNIDIYGPGQAKVNMVMAAPLGIGGGGVPPQASKLKDILADNVGLLPFINLKPGSEILGGDVLGGISAQEIDFKRFKMGEIDLLVTAGWRAGGGGANTVELRCYEVFSQRLVVGRAYENVRDDTLINVANRFCADLMESLTGNGDFFLSTLTFVKRGGKTKEIWASTCQGANLRKLTNVGFISMSPAWSPDGRYMAFTIIDEKRHMLGVYDAASNSVRKVKLPGDVVISPSFMSNGTPVCALNPKGSPNIFALSPDFSKITRPLIEAWSIEISPSFDRAGAKMAYVSSRNGGPQIYLLDLGSGQTSRVSYEGTYNTNPSISPDGTMVVYSRLTPQGHRIYLNDLTTGESKPISFGPGNDVSPSWAPDGYFVTFASDRAGGSKIYLTTRHGDPAKLIMTGDGESFSPTWKHGKRQDQ